MELIVLDAVLLAFLVAGTVLILGYLGEEFFKKTSIPDPLILLIFGLFLGPLLNVFPREELVIITPYFAALALIVILFDGGLNMNVVDAIKNSPRALLLGFSCWFLNVIVTALLCKFILEWRFLNGLLLGTIVGGSSSIIVIALSRKINLQKETATILCLESILTDVLCTIGAFVIIEIILSGQIDLYAALGSIALAFSVGIIVGSIVGIAWLCILERIKGAPNTYIITLGVLLLTYFIARNFGGTGAISALFAGLIIGNAPQVSKLLKFTCTISVDDTIRGFHSQISFLMRSFFFVFTGLLFSFSSVYLVLFGLGLSFVFLGLRFLSVKVSFFKSDFKESEKIVTIMLPRGLAAAVLASLPFTSGVPGSEAFTEISFVIIIATIIICTIGVVLPRLNKPRNISKRIRRHLMHKTPETFLEAYMA
jgi:potassium/hydrogen antiporter